MPETALDALIVFPALFLGLALLARWLRRFPAPGENELPPCACRTHRGHELETPEPRRVR